MSNVQPFNTAGYGVYGVWAYSVKDRETTPTTPPTTSPTTPSTNQNQPAFSPIPSPTYPVDSVNPPVYDGWIPASSLPKGAKVTATKWIYDLTQYFETTDPNLNGWTMIGSEWRQIGSGSIEYATFPDGFDKSNIYYQTYNNAPVIPFDNGNTKREVSTDRTAYIYWHWTYEPGLPGSSVNNRYIQEYPGYDRSSGFTFDDFHAFKDTNDYEYYSQYGVYKYNASQYWSWWWYRLDLMKSTYTDYVKYYKYSRAVKTESYSYPNGEGVSNIQEWVMFEMPAPSVVPKNETPEQPVIPPSNLPHSPMLPSPEEDLPGLITPPIVLEPYYVRTCAYYAYGNNYFKLRDIAYLLSGTPAQFSVDYDSISRAILLTSGREYVPVGNELMGKSAPDSSAVISTNTIYINGKRYFMKAYNIGGNNYFMLRDIASALNFDVDWDSATGNIIIEPGEPYDG